MKLHPRGTTEQIVQGQAGVHRVASELLLRRHIPYIPIVDVGVDLVVDGRLRVQVKSTARALRHSRYKPNSYSFTLSKAQTIVQRKYVPSSARTFSDACDFVVLWAIAPNRFWIVPAYVLDGRHTVLITDNEPQWKPCDIDEAKRLRSTGMSYHAIAEQLGVAEWTVKRRLNGSFAVPKKRYANMAQYENRWDLITGALATLSEANAVVGAASQPTVAGVEPSTISEA